MARSDRTSIFTDQDVDELARARALLRAELSTIVHWRRVIRARIDLCTAHVAPPLPLATQITEYFTKDELPSPPEITHLHTDVLTGLDELHASTLPHLKNTDIALRQYERTVRRKYMALSDELAQRHAH